MTFSNYVCDSKINVAKVFGRFKSSGARALIDSLGFKTLDDTFITLPVEQSLLPLRKVRTFLAQHVQPEAKAATETKAASVSASASDMVSVRKWKISIEMRNENHEVVSVLWFDDALIEGDTPIRKFVDPKMLPHMRSLTPMWMGFGLFAQHEPVKDLTTFDDVAYQRSDDGSLLLQCENHNCKYRPILTPVVKEPNCLVCGKVNDVRSCLLCMHYAACSACFATISACPKCKKRKTAW